MGKSLKSLTFEKQSAAGGGRNSKEFLEIRGRRRAVASFRSLRSLRVWGALETQDLQSTWQSVRASFERQSIARALPEHRQSP